MDLTTGASSSTLTVPPATASVKEFGIIPVTATTEMIQDGPATGTANLSTNTITSTAHLRQLYDPRPPPLDPVVDSRVKKGRGARR